MSEKKFLDKTGLQKAFELIKDEIATISSGASTIIGDIKNYFDINGILKVEHGGTGANNLNGFVKTTGNQTISGTKTFNSTIAGSISGNAATATTATKLGSSTIGGTFKPIYLYQGAPRRVGFNETNVQSNVGSATNPIYLGTDGLTASDGNVGGNQRIMYMTSGTLTAGKRIETVTTLPSNLSNYNVGDVFILYSNS